MDGATTKSAPPQREWAPFLEVLPCLDGKSRRQGYRRMKEGHPHFLVSRPRNDGKPGRLIYIPSLNDDEKQLWLKKQLLKLDSGATLVAASTPSSDNRGQGHLWPDTEADRQLKALQAQCGEDYAADAMRKRKAIAPLDNHEYMVLGLRSKTALARKQAPLLGVTPAHVLRLHRRYVDGGELIAALANKRPGPAKGEGSILDTAIRGRIRECWEERLLNKAQTSRDVIDWVKWKQDRCRDGYSYSFLLEAPPKRWMAVERFIDFIGGEDNTRRRRNLGLIERAGYIDRLFEDEFSGDTWCIDEWELDGVFYNPRRRDEIFWGDSNRKPYLISVIDERSTYVLGATLTLNLSAETVLALLEALVRAYGPPIRLVSDKGGHFRKGVGGRIKVHSRGELVERCMGAMANFGVEHEQPRTKNPRGNRQERTLHGEYAKLARRDFGPSWKGANVEQRKLTEIDERVSRHLREHCKQGTCGPQILSYDDADCITTAWRDEINMMAGESFRPSGTDPPSGVAAIPAPGGGGYRATAH